MKTLLASCLVVALLALPACGRKQEKAETTSNKVTVVKAEHKQTRTSGAVQGNADVAWDDEDLK